MRRLIILILSLLPLSARPSDTTAVRREIIHTEWYSSREQIYRRVDIYIPDSVYRLQVTGYRGVPALYLIHGINGYEGSWQDLGSAADTLEALIASGRCQPVILIMPDCNKWPLKERPISHGNLWKCLTHYRRLSREHEIEYAVSELMDIMDTIYPISSRAIAGLSDGARMAANVANIRQTSVQAVGLFSPVLHSDQLPGNTDQCYCIYVGKQDIFAASGKRFHRRMNKKNHPHQFIRLEGGHTWRVWRQCLSDFLEQL